MIDGMPAPPPPAPEPSTRADREALRAALNETARQPLRREQCILLVIDLQEKLLPAIFEKERVLKHTRQLLNLAKIIHLPIILTTQYAKGLGPTVPEIAEEVPEVRPIDKLQFGCFGNPDFCQRVSGTATAGRVLLVAGIESHICVAQTVLGALASDFIVHVAADAVSSRSAFNWHIGLERMKAAGALISSTEMIVYELLAQSGTEEFKRMLPFLK